MQSLWCGTGMDKAPDKVGKYKLIREVGRGATATVYLAEHPQYPEPVALKLIRFYDKAKDEAKYRVFAAHMLGKCFAAQGWHGEAVGEFKEALQALDAGNAERELEIKYDLMNSLIEQAKAEKNAQAARDAAEICSYILRKNIAFRDIRDRRKQVDALVKEIAG